MNSLVESVISELRSTTAMDDLLYLQTPLSLDSNNNSSDGATNSSPPSKYSLRPRSLQKRRFTQDAVTDDENAKVVVGAVRRGAGSGGRRCKQKPPPLSKYRRKTANARERDRMREINAAFETLRRAVPPHAGGGSVASGAFDDDDDPQQRVGEKLTKITTLRLAMRYIAALTHALEAASAGTPASAATSQAPSAVATQAASLQTAVSTPPPPTLCQTLLLPPGVDLASDGESLTFHSDLSADGHCLTPPHSLTSSSADFVVPDFGDSLTPPDFCGGGGGGADFGSIVSVTHGHHTSLVADFCLTPPPGFEEHCLAPP